MRDPLHRRLVKEKSRTQAKHCHTAGQSSDLGQWVLLKHQNPVFKLGQVATGLGSVSHT